jgi:hypothetical protein
MSKCCSHGTFLPFSLQSSHLNICYYHQDLHQRPLHPGSRPRLRSNPRVLLLIGAYDLPQWPGIGRPLQRHPFSGLADSAGELLHTPWRVSTSMTTFLLSGSANTLCGVWVSGHLGALTWLSDHPASPVLLTKNGPLGTRVLCPRPIKRRGRLARTQFENRPRMFHPRNR